MAQAFKFKFVSDGGMIDYTPASAVTAGDPVVSNGQVYIANRNIAANALGALALTCGIWDGVKVNGTVAFGVPLYWDADGDPQGGTAGSGALTSTSTGNTFVGYCVLAAGATDETVRFVKFPAVTVTNSFNPLSTALSDPGDEGAIPVTNSGYVPIITSEAETRTLAAPNHAGQQLLLIADTLLDTCTITCATGINQTGNNTITLDTAGDSVLLVAIYNGENLRWRVVYNDGATLSTAT
jgi:predicted RecA/RadA family phage recombinase